jgi:hypothetical protein
MAVILHGAGSPNGSYAQCYAGILLAVGALEAAGLLQQLAVALGAAVPNVGIVAAAIGVVSALIDNVPLVAATMGMYDLALVPPDSQLWQLIALAAGGAGWHGRTAWALQGPMERWPCCSMPACKTRRLRTQYPAFRFCGVDQRMRGTMVESMRLHVDAWQTAPSACIHAKLHPHARLQGRAGPFWSSVRPLASLS